MSIQRDRVHLCGCIVAQFKASTDKPICPCIFNFSRIKIQRHECSAKNMIFPKGNKRLNLDCPWHFRHYTAQTWNTKTDQKLFEIPLCKILQVQITYISHSFTIWFVLYLKCIFLSQKSVDEVTFAKKRFILRSDPPPPVTACAVWSPLKLLKMTDIIEIALATNM